MKRLILLFFTLAMPVCRIMAGGGTTDGTYRWMLSTNICDWALLGTINAQMQVGLSEHVSMLAGARYNPFIYFYGQDNQTCLKQAVPYVGCRYWFRETYSGWYCEGKSLAGIYNIADPIHTKYYEGDLLAAGAALGHSGQIYRRCNMTLAAGLIVAAHRTTLYAAPRCGRIIDRKKGFILLPDITLSIDLLM